MYPYSYIFITSGTQLTTTYFHGSLDETRYADALGARLTLRDEAGTVLRDHYTFIPPVTVPAGAYQFDLSRTIRLEGAVGEAHLTSRFDSRRADGAAPTMTGMRLLDGEGRVVTKLRRRSTATLHFSAIDRVQVANGATRGYVAEEATAARWRPHGETEWRTLTSGIVAREMANGVEEVTALGHVPVGTVWRADLSEATRASTALIDLRLEFRDAAGNTYEYTLAPAFAVEDPTRRRSVRH